MSENTLGIQLNENIGQTRESLNITCNPSVCESLQEQPSAMEMDQEQSPPAHEAEEEVVVLNTTIGEPETVPPPVTTSNLSLELIRRKLSVAGLTDEVRVITKISRSFVEDANHCLYVVFACIILGQTIVDTPSECSIDQAKAKSPQKSQSGRSELPCTCSSNNHHHHHSRSKGPCEEPETIRCKPSEAPRDESGTGADKAIVVARDQDQVTGTN